MDQLIELLAELSQQIMPILFVALTVYIIIFVKKLIDVLKATEEAIQTSNKTLNTVDTQIQKLDAPLATLENVSHTIDDANNNARKMGTLFAQQILQKFKPTNE